MNKIQFKKDLGIAVHGHGYTSSPTATHLPKDTLAVSESTPSTTTTLSLEELLADPMLVVFSINEGVPSYFFKHLFQEFPFTEEEWAYQLHVSTKSLQRYIASPTHIFRPIHSEKILALAEVFFLGLSVFGSKESCYNWLKRPSLALGQITPFELMRSAYGKEMVITELNNIEHGIFA